MPYKDQMKRREALLTRKPGERIERTAVIVARTDIRLLAVLEDFFRSKGVFPSSRSELIRLSLEHLHDHLFLGTKEIDRPFDSWGFGEALSFLERYGSLHKAGQNRERLAVNISQETIEEEKQAYQVPYQFTPTLTPEQIKAKQDEAYYRYSNTPQVLFIEKVEELSRTKLKGTKGYVEQDPEEKLPDVASLDPDILSKLTLVEEEKINKES
jgi:hypothetical protein